MPDWQGQSRRQPDRRTLKEPAQKDSTAFCQITVGPAPGPNAGALNPTVPHFPYGIANQAVCCNKKEYFGHNDGRMEGAQKSDGAQGG